MPITAMSPSCRIHSCSLVYRMALIGLLLSAVIAGGDERQKRDTGRARQVAHHQREGVARAGMRGIDIAHRDRRTDRRTETATGHPADFLAGPIEDGRALTRGGAAIRADAHTFSRGTVGELFHDNLGARKCTTRAPAFTDGPGEPGLDRRGGLVDVVAVEAEPGFEAQRVAGAEPDW